MAQSVKCLTLDFVPGHDFMFAGLSSTLGSVLASQSLLGILSLPLSLFFPYLLARSLPKEINTKNVLNK